MKKLNLIKSWIQVLKPEANSLLDSVSSSIKYWYYKPLKINYVKESLLKKK